MHSLVRKASVVARISHAGQVRKYTGEPYIEHPKRVAEIIESLYPASYEMLAAAWLHDTVEDTAVEIDDIRILFGDAVADLVGWLTDASKPEDGNRKVRKQIDLEHIAKAPWPAKAVKLADLIDNTGSIVQYDPDFARVYLQEKVALLSVLTDADDDLWDEAAKQVSDGLARLDSL